MPFWESRFRYVPGGSFQSGATQTNGGAIFGRRGALSGVAFVISPPASTTRADGSNVGEEIGRSATSIAAPFRCSPADVAEQAGQTDARTSSQRSRRYCGVAIVIPRAELTTREGGTRRGTKVCARRQFGIVA